VYELTISYAIKNPVHVFCEMDPNNGGWTVIQRRVNGGTDFDRTWDEYKKGFGQATSEYWMGNDNLAAMTSDKLYSLRIEMIDNEGEKYLAEYAYFSIRGESNNYALSSLGQFRGNTGDSLTYHLGQQFSTKDRDNDNSDVNCAELSHGGWWYKSCQNSNLNGEWGSISTGQGINWATLTGYNQSLKAVTMMLIPYEWVNEA